MKNENPNHEVYYKEYVNTFAYYSKNNQKVAAINLWANGFTMFHGATIIREFDAFKNISISSKSPPDFQTLLPYINDGLADDIRIVTCFENFMKGTLILSDIVVHKVSKKNKSLRKNQENRPINKSEIFNSDSFLNFDFQNKDKWETSFQTLNFSWMLKPQYQAVINIPSDVLSIITKINDDRNKLHFMNLKEFSISNLKIDEYSKLISFVDTTIRKCIADLNENMSILREEIRNK